jgi:hypothetical protein
MAVRVSRSGGLHVADEPLVEPRGQPLLEVLDVLRRLVGRDDDLLPGVAQRVERVEELLLRALFAGQELDVVDEQHVHVPVFVPERQHLGVLDRVDHLVHEPLGRHVRDARAGARAQRGVADGLQQVRLAEAGAAEDEQRVVDAARVLGDGEAGGVREAVAAADDEAVERQAWIERAAVRADRWLGNDGCGARGGGSGATSVSSASCSRALKRMSGNAPSTSAQLCRSADKWCSWIQSTKNAFGTSRSTISGLK